jgi:hypothetical protein
MKKTLSKLTLHRETIRVLSKRQLADAGAYGAVDDGESCTVVSHNASTCLTRPADVKHPLM